MTRLRVFATAAAVAIAGVSQVTLAGPAAAQAAACTAPAPPAPVALSAVKKPTLPDKPACAANNKCKQADIGAYNALIDKYNNALFASDEEYNRTRATANAYIAALNTYSANVDAYLNCERRRLLEIENASR
ncbi:hypothetical protein BH11PSE2_BH11PSE2_18920 [soil metagenome]